MNDSTLEQQITYGFRQLTARYPEPEELNRLTDIHGNVVHDII